ncbi:GNAT family N-acetyltransferase [Undibacterium flavidum]|uniref:GNAT family N-acetyltransferase n=1 Tax=Undibacterium flavidum TaxID=2762297 RepID=A0ABR6YAE4_9BURK|nr:GNAT family N-acetyltransferase [Undibacterium flavidum]MBC3873114.1 GNAT family N-acetyltransferase [Undibacterium flavidum]
MITLKRTDSNNADFQGLVVELDRYLAITDGDEHAFYAQYNKSDGLKYVIVAYDGDKPVACGAIKNYADDVMEVKRMYVAPSARGKGVASSVLKELESWTVQLSRKKILLETGVKQLEAIRLYQRSGYQIIPNYGQYQGVKNSVCFEKTLEVLTQDKRAEINIRYANADDAEVLTALGKETFHDAFSVYPQMPPADLASYLIAEFTVANLKKQLADEKAFFLLAEHAGEAVGYAKMEVHQGMPGVQLNNPIKLRRLYCKQRFLGLGVGASLMERCVLEAANRKHDGIYLTVWEHNHQAQGFYKKWSYEPCAMIDIILGQAPLRDVVMQKRITSVC